MEENSNINCEKYLVYPNESIDKLTVNRTFERLFEDIDAKISSASLVISGATETSYGTAKFSSLEDYSFEEPSGATVKDEYEKSMLTIGQIDDMSKKMADGSYSAIYVAPTSLDGDDVREIAENEYWVRSKYMDSKFLYMPNGVNMISCSFELGFNGISKALSADDIYVNDVVSPVSLSSYTNQIYVDKESKFNVEDYIGEKGPEALDVRNILNMDGRSMDIPFITDAKVTLRHNNCGFSKYSAYRQSYIEICMSLKIGLKSLYGMKYGLRNYELEDDNSDITESSTTHDGEMKRYRLFTQTPMVMSQIGFYNNDSISKPLFGNDNTLSGGDVSEFSSHNRLSQKPLDETIVDDKPISPVNGSVFVKKVENEYDQDGNIVDNILYMDVVMKFMAGSAADPELEYALDSLNSRSKVQVVMIGV